MPSIAHDNVFCSLLVNYTIATITGGNQAAFDKLAAHIDVKHRLDTDALRTSLAAANANLRTAVEEAWRANAKATKLAATSYRVVDDNVLAAVVNDLRATAIKFHAAGQLRERLIHALGPLLVKAEVSDDRTVQEPVMADGKTRLSDYLEKGVPDNECSDDWTKGYEECKRRLFHIVGRQLRALAAPNQLTDDQMLAAAIEELGTERDPLHGDRIVLAGAADVGDLVRAVATRAKAEVAPTTHRLSADDGAADPVVEANRQLLLGRSRVGIAKYGVTLGDAGLLQDQLVRHALEEALDLANYLQTILQQHAAMSKPVGLTGDQRDVIEEAAQALESAAAHNRTLGRTVFAHGQQDRADRLRGILASPEQA